MGKRIKDNVDSMAAQARRLVTDEEGEAQRSRRHFAWQLGLLGKVFDAVPGCQEPVRMKINILLNTFLEISWGYMYVFKLGMILEQGQGRRPACDQSCQLFNSPCLVCGFEKEFDRNFAVWYPGGLTMETRAVTVVTLASTLRPGEVGRWT